MSSIETGKNLTFDLNFVDKGHTNSSSFVWQRPADSDSMVAVTTKSNDNLKVDLAKTRFTIRSGQPLNATCGLNFCHVVTESEGSLLEIRIYRIDKNASNHMSYPRVFEIDRSILRNTTMLQWSVELTVATEIGWHVGPLYQPVLISVLKFRDQVSYVYSETTDDITEINVEALAIALSILALVIGIPCIVALVYRTSHNKDRGGYLDPTCYAGLLSMLYHKTFQTGQCKFLLTDQNRDDLQIGIYSERGRFRL